MKRPAYENDALPINWKRWQYTTGKHEMISINPSIRTGMGELMVSDLLDVLCEDDSVLNQDLWQGKPYEYATVVKHFVLKEPFSAEFEAKHPQFVKIVKEMIPSCIPSNVVYITVNKDNVRKSGMMIPGDSIPDRMDISLANRNDISKSEMMMLEIIANNNFERPVYMSTTVGTSNYGSLYRHFVQEGIAYRITPFSFEDNQAMVNSVIDTDKMYDNMMNKYAYGNLKQEGLYLDETTIRMCYTHRRWFSALINALVEEGKYDKALKALEKCDAEIPAYTVPYVATSGSIDMAQAYIVCGKCNKADEILQALKKNSIEYLQWYTGLEGKRFESMINKGEFRQELYVLETLSKIYSGMANEVSDEKEKEKYKKEAESCIDALLPFSQFFYSLAQ
jgi:tetratricopeptide (TPR) repeat protein